MSSTQHSRAIQSEIDAKGNRISVVLYANSPPRIAGYLALADAMRRAGHLPILVHPANSRPSPEEISTYGEVSMVSLPPGLFSQLRGVDVFFSPEVIYDLAPPGSTVVGMFHSIPEALTTNYADVFRKDPRIIRSLDYLVVALQQKPEDWTKRNYSRWIQHIYPANFLRQRRETLDIVPGGYPKIDYLQNLLSEESALDTIVYSPTRHLRHSASQVTDYGSTIIRELLSGFPDYRISFRPYPIAADRAVGSEIAKEFAANNRLVLDTSVTGVETLKRCALVVTDRSSSAISFSPSSGRPIIFTDFSRQNASRPTIREAYGFQVFDLEALRAAVCHGLTNQEEWKHGIFEFRKNILYHPGRASDYLAANVPVFARRETLPEWLSVPRTPWTLPEDKAEVEKQLGALHTRMMRRPGKECELAYDEIRSFAKARIEAQTAQ